MKPLRVLLSFCFSLLRLRYVFLAGEHCDYETRNWAEEKIKVRNVQFTSDVTFISRFV